MRNATHNKFSTNGGNAVAAMHDAFEHSRPATELDRRNEVRIAFATNKPGREWMTMALPSPALAGRHDGSRIGDRFTDRRGALAGE
jgi:hypothetical protein